jgi:hypothetical protein
MGGFSNAMFEYQRIPPILGTTLYEFCLELWHVWLGKGLLRAVWEQFDQWILMIVQKVMHRALWPKKSPKESQTYSDIYPNKWPSGVGNVH